MDEDELFRRAAGGNTCALVLLSDWAMTRYRQGMADAVGAAEAFLRLAAANDSLHRVKLASFLLGRGAELAEKGDAERGNSMRWQAAEILGVIVAEGEAEALSALVFALQGLADGGDEQAAMDLNAVMESVAPETAATVLAEVEQVTRR